MVLASFLVSKPFTTVIRTVIIIIVACTQTVVNLG